MSSSLNDRDWEPAGSIHHDPKTARRNAKAEAAAAKARYKASRPWYKRPLTLLGAVLGALVAVVLLSQCGGDDSPGTTGSGSGAVVEQPAEQQLPAGRPEAGRGEGQGAGVRPSERAPWSACCSVNPSVSSCRTMPS